MDRLIYVAMTGAKHTLGQQAALANNLANANTHGFRADLNLFRAVPVQGEGLATRAFVVDSTPGVDLTPAEMQQTGRDLDIAVQGRGFIAVQAEDGSEAYTRNGNLQIGPNGLLQTRDGHNVMGDGGPIAIPPDVVVTIAADGTVSTVPTGTKPNAVAALGRIKMVNPEDDAVAKGADGLFRIRNGEPAQADANVVLASGVLEGSNVNVVEAMVGMIALGRQFEMQMKMLQSAEGNARQAAQLLSVSR